MKTNTTKIQIKKNDCYIDNSRFFKEDNKILTYTNF
ncbi:hypothetical protein N824_22230 [Pedobacter sp. V48]|nr:hypothetical protein N824_22230 [Pedobacter sp. V48]